MNSAATVNKSSAAATHFMRATSVDLFLLNSLVFSTFCSSFSRVWTGLGVILSYQVRLCPAVEMVGPIDHLPPTNRFKARSPVRGMRGWEQDEVGWGNQLCVAINLSFHSPSNGFLFPWVFWGASIGPVGRCGWPPHSLALSAVLFMVMSHLPSL